jgi:tripartite ATP-independent transporter DctP family solute receptor
MFTSSLSRRLLLAAATASAALLTGLGGASAQTKVIRWGDVVGGTHPSVVMIERVGKNVKEKTQGRVEVQGFPGGQLGGSRDMIEAVANNIQTVVTEGAANFGQWVPSISIVEAPYIWRDSGHMMKTLNGPYGEELNQQLIEKRGMRILGATYYGTRHLTTSRKEVKSVADMSGFKLRVPENDVFRAMAESWGARPTPMNFGELYLALSQNAVDGQENPLPTIQAGKFQEVQKFLVLTGHILTPRLVVINESFWKSLGAADQKAVKEAMDEGIAWQNQEIIKAEAALVDTFKAAGMTVITPDVEAFRKATLAAVPPKFEARWGKGTWERIQAVK